MIEPHADRLRRITLGTDKGYDAEDFVSELRSLNVAPHVAAKVRGSAIDGRTTRHAGYKSREPSASAGCSPDPFWPSWPLWFASRARHSPS